MSVASNEQPLLLTTDCFVLHSPTRMKHKFTCPNCGTRFKADIPETLSMVLCPTCGTNIPVSIDEVGTLGDNLRYAATREGNWIIWAAGAFALVWGVVVLVMVMSSRRAPAVVSGT